MRKRKKNSRKKLLVLCIIAVSIVLATLIFIRKKSGEPTVNKTDEKTTSAAPSAQPDYKTDSDRTPQSTNEEKGSAGVSDTGGNSVQTTDSSQWTTSKTGEITVYSPFKNAVLSNGDVVSGASSLSVVYYRIIDNVSGMISQGQLNVVSGKFSGSLSFSTKATEGRLDVYGATDSGKEFSNVEIPIKFK